jgi:hypothetical protein
MCDTVGGSSVYVDVLGFDSRILYGPINFGQSLCALPDGRLRFFQTAQKVGAKELEMLTIALYSMGAPTNSSC